MPPVHWRRLDLPGRDQAELTSTAQGHSLVGAAHFQDADEFVAITYLVTLTPDWQTQAAALRIMTRAGRRRVRITSAGRSEWAVQGTPMPAVSGCVDFDLAFTPATNLISIRRLALDVGARAEVTAAWLDFRANTLTPLRQIYHRISRDRYAYSCPDIAFDSTLRVDGDGFVREYPPVWEEA
jgi:uncharacterized protein